MRKASITDPSAVYALKQFHVFNRSILIHRNNIIPEKGANMPKAAVIMGSDSDYNVVKKCTDQLDQFGIDYDLEVISAHRNPDQIFQYVRSAEDKGIEIIIGAAGKAAHLPGIMAGLTTLPVIGIPIKTSFEGGLDSLLSIVQMPSGVPVATVAVDGAQNAAILAAQILALKYPELKGKLADFKQQLNDEVVEKNRKIHAQLRENK